MWMGIVMKAKHGIAVALMLLATTSSFAGPVEDGQAAWDREDYESAARFYAQAAREGDPRGEGILGLMYAYGMGVAQDVTQGIQWMKRSADHGNGAAANTLGEMYADGKLVSQDWATARGYFVSGAKAGNASAQKNLGDLYYYGRGGIARDYAVATQLYREAAKQNNSEAEYTLGFIYFNGVGTSKDFAEALSWFTLGAQHGSSASEMYVGYAYDSGLGVPQDYSEAVKHYAAAVRGKNIRAIGLLGEKYYNGQGVPRDYAKAYIFLNLAASQIEGDIQKSIVEERDKAAARLTPVQLASAQAVANRCSDEIEKCEALPGGQIATSQPRKFGAATGTAGAPTLAGSGSGFYINGQGQIITNAHVVQECAAVKIASGTLLRTVAVDADSDLALLSSGRKPQTFARVRGGKGARVGETVIAVGFPLPGVLSEGAKVSSGTISALAGLGNDRRNIQISAPVQPGNSGGPLLGDDGAIVGVVSGKLDALKMASAINDIPQNVNFAVSVGTLQSFLNANNIAYEVAAPRTAQAGAALSAEASRYTVRLECWK